MQKPNDLVQDFRQLKLWYKTRKITIQVYAELEMQLALEFVNYLSKEPYHRLADIVKERQNTPHSSKFFTNTPKRVRVYSYTKH